MSGARTGFGRWLLVIACVVVAATLAAAIVVMGPPAAQRAEKLDRSRAHDLWRIERAVDSYAESKGALPPDLDTLARQPGQRLPTADPDGGPPYVYEITGEHSYRLCAVFTTDTAATQDVAMPWANDEWNHGIGRQCFDRKIKHEPGAATR